ncbi:hypothetical protein H2198_006990 [Neophaeococcomyces mojaviensis]|uniref:Uncharacterized protein n=1 Tax=Neophaeococcomyces mojaviensis TaxID=3383035 RepID=A0ACC3A1C3_9EURO|nr:hypothetical protein H2198_006990 [Knufia sp. JES_112]
MTQTQTTTASQAALRYAELSKDLSLEQSDINEQQNSGIAVQAKFITPLDPVIETADGNRLPAVPLEEAYKINALKEKAEGASSGSETEIESDETHLLRKRDKESASQDRNLDISLPPLRTHPLFPPLPLYGPPTLLRNAQCLFFQITSFYLSTGFLLVIVLGAVFTSIPGIISKTWLWFTFRDPDKKRPFYKEEQRRAAVRAEEDAKWLRKARKLKKQKQADSRSTEPSPDPQTEYEPLEGGPDKLLCDSRYYARRVGLEMETFKVQAEDGFIIDLWHIYDPTEYTPKPSDRRKERGPDVFKNPLPRRNTSSKTRYPVLLIHGLLQSAGAYCCNDDDSLAFYLHKSGYDVWLGNNRCGFNPQHTLLKPSDPRMWAWNIRQMGVMDLPAFISRVLSETSCSKLGLVAHSQGTTETFVALAKQQRPDLGEKISVFCALAPAVYAGPLIGKMYFKFMRVISPAMFRIFFGIHAFIPLMMTMHRILPGRMYGLMGYLVFSFLFNWSDERWDRGLRDRAFQFAPVYVSSESMRWWLGRECFAKHKCVLSTREQHSQEDREDLNEELEEKRAKSEERDESQSRSRSRDKGRTAWYDERAPPMALWVAGSDDLVDGKRLLRRFRRGREPHVNLVHSKVIDEYEHLDVLWAMDSIEKVGKEVKEVIWKTMDKRDKERCRAVQGVSEGTDTG